MKQPRSTWPCLSLNLWKLRIHLDFTYNEPFPLSYINSSLVSGEPPHGFLGVWPPCWSNRTLPWWTEMPLGFISRLTYCKGVIFRPCQGKRSRCNCRIPDKGHVPVVRNCGKKLPWNSPWHPASLLESSFYEKLCSVLHIKLHHQLP